MVCEVGQCEVGTGVFPGLEVKQPVNNVIAKQLGVPEPAAVWALPAAALMGGRGHGLRLPLNTWQHLCAVWRRALAQAAQRRWDLLLGQDRSLSTLLWAPCCSWGWVRWTTGSCQPQPFCYSLLCEAFLLQHPVWS